MISKSTNALITLAVLLALETQLIFAAITPLSWTDAYARANATVAQLTLDEKLGIVRGRGQFSSRCVGDTTAVTRLGIPPICFADGPAGLRLTKNVTGFTTGINTAATFSRRLMRARGVALGEEFRGKGAHVYLGPSIDIMRNPKAGRGWEGFGPDPYLNGEAAFETITGVQSVGVQACAKHLIANNQEHWRYGLSSDVDDQTLHEIYWAPYLRAIEADVSSVMAAYNRLNSTSASQNAPLLTQLLRTEGGFKGYVVSDWGATHDGADANANAGLDMEQPGDWILIGGGVFGGLKGAVNDGKVALSRLDQMVARILTPWYRLKQNEADYPPTNFDVQKPDGSGSLNLGVSVRSAAHSALNREISAASHVLLKNINRNAGPGAGSKMLPLANSQAAVGSVAIIGQDAAAPKDGCYLNECNNGVMVIGWGSGSYNLEYVKPPVTALTTKVTSLGGTVATSLSNDLNAGEAAARGKDVAFVFANAMSGELGFYDVVEGNMGDRNDLALWWKGGSLIERVASVNRNTVVVIHSVGPVSLTWSDHPNITAIIYAGAPGEEAGSALVDILWGAFNPSGRLPFSIADSDSQYPGEIVYNSLGFPNINYTEKLLLDYRWHEANGISPRFPFGFGLSYTTFSYSNLSISASSGTYAITVTFAVTNSGAVAGTDHPQLYLSFPSGAGQPPKVLRGFEEVILNAGARSTVTLGLTSRDISIWDVRSQRWARPSGTFTVHVGASIADIRLTGTF